MIAGTIVIGERTSDLASALESIRGLQEPATAVQTKDVVARAFDVPPERRLILFLTERDNLAELRTLLRARRAPVLLIAPSTPPSAALARLAAQEGMGLCGRDEPLAVREALLIALAASRETARS